MSIELVEKLSRIQAALKAPKSQYNSFGKYAYRNCEDILEALKPLLAAEKLVVSITDDIIAVGGRVYVKATVTVSDGTSSIVNSAFAREPLDQKGMNEAQITGSASSYARKYALNGMFLIDDTKDADATNDHGKGDQKPADKVEAKPVDKKAEPAKETPKAEGSASSRFKPNVPKETPKENVGGGWD